MPQDDNRSRTQPENDTDAQPRPPEPKTKLPDQRAKLGDTLEGEGSPGITIGGGGHA